MAFPFGNGKGGQLAQDIMPLDSVQGAFVRTSDGCSCIAISIEGTNDSLYTYEQKLDEAEALASCLVSVMWPTSIVKVPKPIDANASLVRIDAEIAKLKEEVFSCPDAAEKAVLEARLRLLEEKIRPEAEMEALAGDRVVYPTYIVMRFPKGTGDALAHRDASILVERLGEAGRSAHICQAAEAVELLQLYFLPHGVDPSAAAGQAPVMPGRRR